MSGASAAANSDPLGASKQPVQPAKPAASGSQSSQVTSSSSPSGSLVANAPIDGDAAAQALAQSKGAKNAERATIQAKFDTALGDETAAVIVVKKDGQGYQAEVIQSATAPAAGGRRRKRRGCTRRKKRNGGKRKQSQRRKQSRRRQ